MRISTYTAFLLGILAFSATDARALNVFRRPVPSLFVAPNVEQDGWHLARYSWTDADGRIRTMDLVDNTVKDPTGQWGGYARSFRYRLTNEAERVCRGQVDNYPGMGMVVNHFGDSSQNSVRNKGLASTALLAGRNHAIHAFTWRYPIDGHLVDVTVHWFVATGKNDPVYAVTLDTSKLAANAVNADTRAPYSDLAWDGGANVNVDGVAWGENYAFTSLGAPLTLNSGWDYTLRNKVPFVKAWSRGEDAEMGYVQTQTMAQHDAGGYWGTQARGTQAQSGPMPEAYNWPFQINQWQLAGDKPTTSKRLAWGSNYGAVGQTSYPALGDEKSLVGWPYQSYAVYVVLGELHRNQVDRQVRAVEAAQRVRLENVTGGELVTSGPGGVGRSDDVPYDLAGFDPSYGVWRLRRTGNNLPLNWQVRTVEGASYDRPIFVVEGATREDVQLLRNGVALEDQRDYFVSFDPQRQELWVTLNRKVGREPLTLTLQ